jgi:hypothetical protein
VHAVTSFLAPNGLVAFDLEDALLLCALIRREASFRHEVGERFSERESDVLRVLQSASSVWMRADVGTCGTDAAAPSEYSAVEAAARLGVSDRHVRDHAVRLGGRKVGKRWIFNADEIELARSVRIRDGRLRGQWRGWRVSSDEQSW